LKILVFGARGQVGQVLRMTSPYPDAVFLDRAGVDLEDRAAITRALVAMRPQVVINAAALTAVDRAEAEPSLAYAINEAAPAAMAAACAELGARLIHLSTDYVFDGALRRPYRPDDLPHPCNVYGASKLAGEQRVRETRGLSHLILRTSWVYSHLARNFFFTVLELARRGGQLRVVVDQIGSPTSAWALSQAIWRVTRLPDCIGTAHFTDGAAISRHEFALGILAAAAERGLPCGQVAVDAITSEQFSKENPAVAPRPKYSALDATEFRAQLGVEAPDWKRELRAVMDRHVGEHHG
jgi:dTDP-4-dehydrorhamnose reductase